MPAVPLVFPQNAILSMFSHRSVIFDEGAGSPVSIARSGSANPMPPYEGDRSADVR